MPGVGLDSDGHKRLTTGPNFALVGGTEETHGVGFLLWPIHRANRLA